MLSFSKYKPFYTILSSSILVAGLEELNKKETVFSDGPFFIYDCWSDQLFVHFCYFKFGSSVLLVFYLWTKNFINTRIHGY